MPGWIERAARLLLVLAAGLLASPARAQGGAFDYYLLSLSVAPSFCAASPRNAEKDECRRLTDAEFRRTPLTLHGLWPNRARVSTNLQPQECDGPRFAISDRLQAQLRRLMPGGPGLARYEWRKHGTCSGLDPEPYFRAAAAATEGANELIGPALLAQGGTVRIEALLQAVAARAPALAAAIVVDCRFGRGRAGAIVEEVRITLDRDFQPIPAASVGMGQNSGCPGGAGRIPRAPG